MPPEESQFLLLARHFFGRFFDNELVSRHGEMRVTVVQILAVLAVPGLFVSLYLMPRYVSLAFQPPEQRLLALTVDRYLFLQFGMVVMGFITVLEWDALFPDRRDYRILTPLPLPLRAIFTAKLCALVLFLVLFAVDVNGLGAFLFPMAAAGAHEPLVHTLAQAAAHLASLLAASAFIFFFCVALQGVMLNVLSIRLFLRVSPYMQFLLLSALLLLLLLFPRISMALHPWRHANSAVLYLLPPMWFLGIYEVLLGSTDPVMHALAAVAWRGLGTVVLLTTATYWMSYRRQIRRTMESPENGAASPSRIGALAAKFAEVLVVRHPVEQAAFYFVVKTLARSRKHKLFLIGYAGLGFALVLEGLIGVISARGFVFQPSPEMLSVPLVLSFFLLSGMRVVFAVPAELRANWVFRLAEGDERRCLAGARKAMATLGIVPLFAAMALLFGTLWGWWPALVYLIFSLTLAWLLMEALLLNFRKIPFTCSYLPGKSNMTLRGVFYWVGFTLYAYSMARLELWLLDNPLRLAVFYAMAWAGLIALVRYRNRLLEEDSTLMYEEEPEPVVRTLNLSEGLRLAGGGKLGYSGIAPRWPPSD